tara:strand:- start:495 stop:599 length:105 start_codon:yes stop_codon:yes gene_type:complete
VEVVLVDPIMVAVVVPVVSSLRHHNHFLQHQEQL